MEPAAFAFLGRTASGHVAQDVLHLARRRLARLRGYRFVLLVTLGMITLRWCGMATTFLKPGSGPRTIDRHSERGTERRGSATFRTVRLRFGNRGEGRRSVRHGVTPEPLFPCGRHHLDRVEEGRRRCSECSVAYGIGTGQVRRQEHQPVMSDPVQARSPGQASSTSCRCGSARRLGGERTGNVEVPLRTLTVGAM